MQLVIIRGLPGSGKTTFANLITNEVHAASYEADMYFIQPDGTYQFDREKLKDAHCWCQARVADAMHNGIPVIAVSNTFVRKWEMHAYLTLAKTFGYQVTEVTMSGPLRESIHDVPSEVIERMKKEWNT